MVDALDRFDHRAAGRRRGGRPGAARRRAHRARPEPRSPSEARPRRLQLERRDAARRAARRQPARRRRAPGGELEGSLGGEAGSLDRVEVAGPGFVNLFLADAWYRRALAALVDAGDDLGPAPTRLPERILVEFVSANPTGPLHVGGGRGAAYGDAVVRLLAAIGHEPSREYYINDAGSQVGHFADSIAARMAGEELPEDGYQGDYVIDLARKIAAEGIDPGDREAVGRRGIELMIEGVRATLDRFGVAYGQLVLGAQAAMSAARSSARSPSSPRAATPIGTTARSGCGRPSTATTRTGC